MKKYKIDNAVVDVYDSEGRVAVKYFDSNGVSSYVDGCRRVANFVMDIGTEIKEPVTYRVGDRLKHNESGMEYMLVCTEIDGPHEYGVTVHLVSMDTGNSVVEFCPRNHMEILPSEFNIEGLDELTKIEDTNG